MNTHEITELGRRLIRGKLAAFNGVHAADTFIETLEFSNQSTLAYIVNTEQSSSHGRHWVAIIQEPGARFEFFDPLGNGPWHYTNLNMFNSVAFNSHALQNPMTNTSAHICLLLLYFRSHGYSFKFALEWFRTLFIDFGSLTNGVHVIITALKLHFRIPVIAPEQLNENIQSSVAPYIN